MPPPAPTPWRKAGRGREVARTPRPSCQQRAQRLLTYGYDDRNQQTQVKHYDATNALVMTEDNKYDYFGNHVNKSVSDGATTEISPYALDGWNPAILPSPAGRGVGGEGPVGTEGFNVWAKLAGCFGKDNARRFSQAELSWSFLSRMRDSSSRKVKWDQNGVTYNDAPGFTAYSQRPLPAADFRGFISVQRFWIKIKLLPGIGGVQPEVDEIKGSSAFKSDGKTWTPIPIPEGL